MGSKELIESLRKASEERIKQIWKETENDAGQIKAEIARRLAQLRENCARKESLAATSSQIAAVSEANNRSRTFLLTEERALSDRLFSLGRTSLPLLRGADYQKIFGKLARELPPLAWKTIRVNPIDVDLAKKMFTGAEIVSDSTISGGLDAMTEEGKIRVNNTFEKRLERAWVDMLPDLLKEIYAAVERGS